MSVMQCLCRYGLDIALLVAIGLLVLSGGTGCQAVHVPNQCAAVIMAAVLLVMQACYMTIVADAPKCDRQPFASLMCISGGCQYRDADCQCATDCSHVHQLETSAPVCNSCT